MTDSNPRTNTQIRRDLLLRHRIINRHADTVYLTTSKLLDKEAALIVNGLLVVFLIVLAITLLMFIANLFGRNEAIILITAVGAVALWGLKKTQLDIERKRRKNEQLYERKVEENLTVLSKLEDFESEEEIHYGC